MLGQAPASPRVVVESWGQDITEHKDGCGKLAVGAWYMTPTNAPTDASEAMLVVGEKSPPI